MYASAEPCCRSQPLPSVQSVNTILACCRVSGAALFYSIRAEAGVNGPLQVGSRPLLDEMEARLVCSSRETPLRPARPRAVLFDN